MRIQLENIALCDRYLNNEMSDDARIDFEKQLTTEESLRNTLKQMQDLKRAVLRKHIRERIEINRPGTGFNPYLITTVLVLIIGLAAGLFFFNSNPIEKHAINTQNTPRTTLSENQMVDSAGTDPEPPQWVQHSLGGKKLWVEPDIQTFEFESDRGATIRGKEGMVLFVPAHAFIDTLGRPVQGKVELRLVEALGISDMIRYQLHTVSNGDPLESGGMFYTDFRINNTPVRINPKRPFYIEIPTPEEKEGMMIFSSEIDTLGAVNWIDPRPLQKYLVTVPLGTLDFLPDGFADAVKANSPFLHYSEATSGLVDSMYYALPYESDYGESEYQYSLNSRQNADTTYFDGNYDVGVGIQPCCGINPSSIEALKRPEFQNSFIATTAFEKRIKALHKAEKGDQMLTIYLQNLDRDMYVSDSIVARKIQPDLRPTFMAFAKEHLTNIEDGKLYAEQLEAWYKTARAENSDYHRKLAERLAQKNAGELRALQDSLTAMKRSKPLLWNQTRSTSSFVNGNRRSVYAAQWSVGGWGNIDRYLKKVNSNAREVAIVVSDAFPGMEVTQWLGEVNTYTDLLLRDGKYHARFPATLFSKNKDNHVFACAKTAEGYQWAFKRYSPKTKDDVYLKLHSATEEEIKKDLKGVEMNFGRLHQKMEVEAMWQAERIEQMLKAQREHLKWMDKRNEIMAEYHAECQYQEEVNEVVFQLRQVAFPCPQVPPKKVKDIQSDSAEVEVLNTALVFTIVEQMPSFPGGDEALRNFIHKNLKYPESALEAKLSGVVYVTFVVNAEGDIKNPKILRGLSPDCDAAVLDLVRKMPKWNPGKQRKTAVPVQYNLPVTFSMN